MHLALRIELVLYIKDSAVECDHGESSMREVCVGAPVRGDWFVNCATIGYPLVESVRTRWRHSGRHSSVSTAN